MRENKKKESLFAKRGFFITLVVIVAAMVITLVMNLILPEDNGDTFDDGAWEEAVRQSMSQADISYQEEAAAVNAPAVPETATPSPTASHPSALEEQAESTVANSAQNPPESPSQDGEMKMESPVPGAISKDFSADELVYSDTMQDWRVHEGIDFSAEEGTDVKAAADGTVESVNQDGMLGACIVIVHNDTTKTFYGNLQEDSMPPIGTAVKAGQVIGKVGRTAALEINDTPHLHFEVIENNKSINPHPFLKDTVTDDE